VKNILGAAVGSGVQEYDDLILDLAESTLAVIVIVASYMSRTKMLAHDDSSAGE